MESIAVGSSVVMDVDDAIEALVDDVIDDLVDTFHPLGIDLAVFIHVIIPGDWHADGAKAGLLHHLDQLGLGRLLPPARLGLESLTAPEVVAGKVGDEHVVNILAVGLEGIT